jgi:protein-S-isoprenylcysteine O-methyltransferase Ste14
VSTTSEVGVAAGAKVSSAVSAAYAGGAYLAFLVAFLYAVFFQAGVLVPRTVDGGGPVSGTAAAVVIDVLLLGLFAVQHSVMARPAFKLRLMKIVPKHLERSTFVLATAGVLALLFWQWRPIPTALWRVDGQAAQSVLWALFAAGWAFVIAMTFAIDHCDMFGLRQVARRIRGLGESETGFRLPWPHRLVRHPMMLGFFPAFLAAPTMTVSHLLFAILGCGYILIGVRLEERDLVEAFPQYRAYAASTPRFVPRPTALRRRGRDKCWRGAGD